MCQYWKMSNAPFSLCTPELQRFRNSNPEPAGVAHSEGMLMLNVTSGFPHCSEELCRHCSSAAGMCWNCLVSREGGNHITWEGSTDVIQSGRVALNVYYRKCVVGFVAQLCVHPGLLVDVMMRHSPLRRPVES